MAKVWEVIIRPQDGYSPEKLVELQRLNQREWNFTLIGTLLAVGGVLAYKLALRLRN